MKARKYLLATVVAVAPAPDEKGLYRFNYLDETDTKLADGKVQMKEDLKAGKSNIKLEVGQQLLEIQEFHIDGKTYVRALSTAKEVKAK